MKHHEDIPQDPCDIPASQVYYEYFKDKLVDIYLGENSGQINYSDYSISTPTQVTGVIKGYRGNILFVEVVSMNTLNKVVKNIVLINCWFVYGIMEENKDVYISTLFQPPSRKRA